MSYANRQSTYCRKLEDNSGFVVVQTILRETSFYMQVHHGAPRYAVCQKWENVLGLGSSRDTAWSDYRKRKERGL